jgi:CYTH domain-containing protein
MTTLRQFIVAPSLARLIEKERGGERVLEGYFPDQPHQNAYVQVEEHRGGLFLLSNSPEGSIENRADIPSAHAQALLAVAAGRVNYIRTSLSFGPYEIQLQRFAEPDPLDLISVEVEQDDQAFQPLSWFGPEVSAERAYQRRRMALDGLPAVPEVEVTNEALNSLLDVLENRLSSWPLLHQAPASGEQITDQTISPHPSGLDPLVDADQDTDDPGLEDDVIRELARSLRPQRR